MKTNITVKALGLSVAIVACLTLFSDLSESAVFFYILYPGWVVRLLTTGGHGGTNAQERIAPVLGFIVNTVAYFGLCLALLAIFPKRNER